MIKADLRVLRDSRGKLMTPEEYNLDVLKACREVHDHLGEMGKCVVRYWIRFVTEKKSGGAFRAEEVSWLGVTIFVPDKICEAHFTKWIPYSESPTGIRPTKKEIVESLSVPFTEFIKSLQP